MIQEIIVVFMCIAMSTLHADSSATVSTDTSAAANSASVSSDPLVSNPVTDYIKVLDTQITQITKDLADKQAANAPATDIQTLKDRLTELTARRASEDYIASTVLPITIAVADAAADADVADALLGDDTGGDDASAGLSSDESPSDDAAATPAVSDTAKNDALNAASTPATPAAK